MTRVVAGDLGGRRLTVPSGRGTRPTSERVREGLFSTLVAMRGSLSGAAFLDLYAGSGAVGIEAASRGAARVTCVERDPRALSVLRSNVEAMAPAVVDVSASSVERFLRTTTNAAWDVVFLDPPYSDPVEGVLTLLTADAVLALEAVLVIERSARDPAPGWPAGVEPDRSRRYGDTVLWYGLWYGRRP
jgi:16S rRNA (guanine966-N2)-methyltransferase